MTRQHVAGVGDFPIIVLQSRGKAFRFWLIAAAFVAIGLAMCVSREPDKAMEGILVAGFFGLGLIVFSLQLLRPGRLVIDAHGITQTAMFKTHRFPWSEAANFRVWRVPYTRNKLVAFDDLRPPTFRPKLRAVNREFGAEAALAPGWAMPPERLAALLNAARSRCLGADGQG